MRVAVLVTVIVASLLLPLDLGAAPAHPSLPGTARSQGDGRGDRQSRWDLSRFAGERPANIQSGPGAATTSSTGPLGNLFDGLVEDNGETTVTEPALAESWSTSPDGKTWTFTLRQGLRWQDGAPVTADDVMFTFRVIYDKNIPNSLADVLTVDGKPITVAKVNDLTVHLHDTGTVRAVPEDDRHRDSPGAQAPRGLSGREVQPDLGASTPLPAISSGRARIS